MQYVSKGIVISGSTENILKVSHCGYEFQLAGDQAAIWLNGRFGFYEVADDNQILTKSLMQLKKQELVEIAEQSESGQYRALTQCIIFPAQPPKLGPILTSEEKRIFKWINEAGLRLTMAELVYLQEHNILPEDRWLGERNRQALTERIYTQETIFDNILEAQMEQAIHRDKTVRIVLSLLRKRRILLL